MAAPLPAPVAGEGERTRHSELTASVWCAFGTKNGEAPDSFDGECVGSTKGDGAP
jgi:hypothetical protein